MKSVGDKENRILGCELPANRYIPQLPSVLLIRRNVHRLTSTKVLLAASGQLSPSIGLGGH